jgi:cyclophilin family peptidyl-prolyl cis-trans isomerase
MSRRLLFVCALVLGLLAAPAQAAKPQVALDTTAGTITLELYPEAAPKTVENFLRYVKDGLYSGTQFHRVIKGFMIQGGGFDANFWQKPTRAPIPIEAQQSAAAGLSNVPGTVAMARTGDPNSATSQFFINVGDNKRLDFRSPDAQGYGYTVFGKVVSGMDVVNKIKGVPTGAAPGAAAGMFTRDVPKTPVVIESATIVN